MHASNFCIPLWLATGLCAAAPELIFRTGFEGSTQVVAGNGANDKLIGRDEGLGAISDWGLFGKAVSPGLDYTGGDKSKRSTDLVADPVHPGNRVLHFWIKEPWLASENQVKARVQMDIYGIKGGYKEFYQSVRVFVPEDFRALRAYPHAIPWLTISEFWNNEWWVAGEPYGFRVTLGIGKPGAAVSDLNFILNAEDMGQVQVWKANNTALKVPIGKWFTLEYYFLEGDAESGRFWVAITPEGEARQTVFDVHDYTRNTMDPAPDGLTGYNPLKLYTSADIATYLGSQGKMLHLYWDDFALWRGRTPETPLAIPARLGRARASGTEKHASYSTSGRMVQTGAAGIRFVK